MIGLPEGGQSDAASLDFVATPRPSTPGPRGRHRRRRRRRLDSLSLASLPTVRATVFVPVACGLVALGIACYQLSLPHVLLGVHGYSGIGYDDGVYLGAAIRLLHGVLPYRDFDFLHPPGITLLMAPVAALERFVGARDALAVARCLTAVVAGLNAALAAMVVRHRGPSAMLVAGIALACFPLAVSADHSLMLEPYLVCFCLLGAVALFRRGELSGRRQVFLAGIAFGFAGAIKVWAILPVLAALICCLPRFKRGVRPLTLGVVVGFGLPSLPFLALAPSAFVHDVVVSQLGRGTSGVDALSVAQRLVMITGISGLPGVNATTTLAVGISLGIVALAVLVYALGFRRLHRLDWFVVTALAIVLAGMFLSPEFYDHYAYFPAAFIALLIGVCASGIVDGGRWMATRLRARRNRALAVGVSFIPVAAVLVAGVLAIPQDASYARSYLSASNDPGAVTAAHIPDGACVVFDESVLAINADRFNPSGSGCPANVDPFGMWIARDNGQPPPATRPFPTAFVNDWRSWLERADYVVLSIPQSDYLPWTPDLVAWFNKNYLLMSSQPRTYVYNHFTRVSSGTAQALLQDGIAADARGNLARARNDFGAILSVDPANTDAYFDLGVVDQKAGLSGLAATEYQQAFFLNPKFAPALFNLAILTSSTSPSKAIALYRQILTIKPSDPDTEFNLGILLLRNGQSAEGQTMLENAVHADPSLRSKLPVGITVP
jgi:hypothetical protein